MKADPPCFDNKNRYVDCGNGTVTDTVTGLVWLQNSNCFEAPMGYGYVNANQEAAELKHGDCDLSDNSSPGDWRLPTKAEWEETIARAVALGCIYSKGKGPALTNKTGTGCYKDETSHVFSGVPSVFYWSSTSRVEDSGYAWEVTLGDGYLSDPVKTSGFSVWPVRGGK